MNIEPISFNTICNVGYFGLLLFVLIVPSWLAFAPPRSVRAWRPEYRLLFIILAAQAAVYALFYGFVYPSSYVYARAHPGTLLCGILCARPSFTWLPIAILSILCLAVHTGYVASTSPADASSLPPNRNG